MSIGINFHPTPFEEALNATKKGDEKLLSSIVTFIFEKLDLSEYGDPTDCNFFLIYELAYLLSSYGYPQYGYKLLKKMDSCYKYPDLMYFYILGFSEEKINKVLNIIEARRDLLRNQKNNVKYIGSDIYEVTDDNIKDLQIMFSKEVATRFLFIHGFSKTDILTPDQLREITLKDNFFGPYPFALNKEIYYKAFSDLSTPKKKIVNKLHEIIHTNSDFMGSKWTKDIEGFIFLLQFIRKDIREDMCVYKLYLKREEKILAGKIKTIKDVFLSRKLSIGLVVEMEKFMQPVR